MDNFGWDLPPGTSHGNIESAFGGLTGEQQDAVDEFDRNIHEYILEDVEASGDLLCLMLDGKHLKFTIDECINLWCKSPFGKRWCEEQERRIINEN